MGDDEDAIAPDGTIHPGAPVPNDYLTDAPGGEHRDLRPGAVHRAPRAPVKRPLPPQARSPRVTAEEKRKAETELRSMKRSLKDWLKFRDINNAVATGRTKGKYPTHVARIMIKRNRDWAHEQTLALELYALLSEVMDPQNLPDPDLSKDSDAAAKLARIAIAGKVEGEGPAEAQGLIWLWPAVVVVGLVMFAIVTKIRSDADVAKERERYECIRQGKCTDYGFWLKVGGMVMVGWFAWEKLGVGVKVKKLLK
jgi:hypothetical protein